jgi:hypothetical protein
MRALSPELAALLGHTTRPGATVGQVRQRVVFGQGLSRTQGRRLDRLINLASGYQGSLLMRESG